MSYLFFVWLHVLASVSWIGGMLFLSFILAPLIRNGSLPGAPALFRSAALRFRVMAWSAVAVLLTTGPALLFLRLSERPSWPPILTLKLVLVVLLLLLTVAHDVVLSPHLSRIGALRESERTATDALLLRGSRWLPRFALLVALGVLFAAALLARS